MIRRTMVTVDEKGNEVENFFSTHYDWMQDEGEHNCGESIVDPSGYIPAKNRIENLLRAGERLDAYRRELYDYSPDDEDDGFVDPTRSPGFDPSDASRLSREAMDRIRTAQAASTVKTETEAHSVASTADKTVSTEKPANASQDASGSV